MDSPVLRMFIFFTLGHIVRDKKVVTAKEISDSCSLKIINAGRIIGRLRTNINEKFIEEEREGPSNHIFNSFYLTKYENPGDEDVPVSKLTVKGVYNNLIATTFASPICEAKWQTILQLAVSPNWNKIWVPKDNLLDHDDKDIWFRIKHRTLPTKDKLYMMGSSHDDLCCLCESNLETIEHLFLYCQKTLQCWIFIEMLLRKYHNNKFLFINDCYRILGYGRYMDDIGLFLTGNMLKTIILVYEMSIVY